MSYFSTGRIVFLAALAAAQTLSAQVGLINQRAALAGKVTSADTAGFPITISEPGSYRLTGNLTVSDVMTTAIQVTADDVTIDLGGFAIIGPNSCTGNPVRCTNSGGGIGIQAVNPDNSGPANVRVMNGTVRGMGAHGIRLMGPGTAVERVHSVSNGGPGIVVGEGSVIDSVARLNGSGAAVVGTIVRGTIASNNIFGIFVRPGGMATGNVTANNAVGGMLVSAATAHGNTSTYNGTYGFEVTCPSSFTGNTAHHNGGANFQVGGVCALADNAQ